MDNPAMKPANTGTWPLGYINKAQPNDVENQWKTHGFQTDQDLYMVDVFLFFGGTLYMGHDGTLLIELDQEPWKHEKVQLAMMGPYQLSIWPYAQLLPPSSE